MHPLNRHLLAACRFRLANHSPVHPTAQRLLLPVRPPRPGLVREVIRRVDANEYKRRQAVPGLRVTSKAFGMGRRLPIAQKYRGV